MKDKLNIWSIEIELSFNKSFMKFNCSESYLKLKKIRDQQAYKAAYPKWAFLAVSPNQVDVLHVDWNSQKNIQILIWIASHLKVISLFDKFNERKIGLYFLLFGWIQQTCLSFASVCKLTRVVWTWQSFLTQTTSLWKKVNSKKSDQNQFIQLVIWKWFYTYVIQSLLSVVHWARTASF